MSKRTPEAFDAELFETRLEALKDTQEGIQKMSSWCLQQRNHHKKIVTSWLNVFKRVRVEHRLTLFYLANDVIQYSKRRRYEFVESWATALQKATTMVRDAKVKNKILRIFHIWEQRRIYNEEYLSDLCGLLNITPPKKDHDNITVDSDDYQNHILISRIRDCVELSENTDKSFKKLPKSPDYDIEHIKQQLKDRNHSDDIEKEIERYITYIEAFNKNLQSEIKSRKLVIANIERAIKFYSNQKNEVKVVFSAYKNFGSRIKLVKKKLDEVFPNLPSPIPSPDINAPSPEPDADIHLPGEQSPVNSANVLKHTFNGYSSYMDGNLPFDVNDFKRSDSSTKIANQTSETIACGAEKEGSFHSSRHDYYETEPTSTYTGSNNIQIPGLTPMPVPAVPSGGYTSLARAAQQYSDVLSPPANPSIFGIANSNTNSNTNLHQINSNYAGSDSYNSNNNYDPNIYDTSRIIRNAGGNSSMQPLMPPPPLPTSASSLDALGLSGVDHDDFNTNWGDINSNWSTPLDSASASASTSYGQGLLETPVSPPDFEQEARNSSSTPLEYSEHNSDMSDTQDVDLRQLHLPAFGITTKMCVSKEKSRQLDIDHRNLISLTGSPGANDSEKKSWLSSASVDEFQSLTSEDIDYRTFGQNIKTIETTNLSTTTATEISDNNISSISSTKKNAIQSPSQKNINVTVSESKRDDADDVSGGMGYDPTDMVVDMDMSDDDLDDIVREVNEQRNEQNSPTDNDVGNATDHVAMQTGELGHLRNIPLLETPTDYGPPKMWEAGDGGGSTSETYANTNIMDEWNQMSWVNSADQSNHIPGHSHAVATSPARQPYSHLSYAYASSNDNVSADAFVNPTIGVGRGGPYTRGLGRAWSNLTYRPYPPRPLHGAGGGGIGVPVAGATVANNGANMAYYRGGARLNNPSNMLRGGAYRGKYRGKTNWN